MSNPKEGTHSSASRSRNSADILRRKAVVEFLEVVSNACHDCPSSETDSASSLTAAIVPTNDGITIRYSQDADRRGSGRASIRVNGLDFKFAVGRTGVELVRTIVDLRTRAVLPEIVFHREKVQDVTQFLRNPNANMHLLGFICEQVTPLEANLVGSKVPQLFVA